jgi:hypothetical protein
MNNNIIEIINNSKPRSSSSIFDQIKYLKIKQDNHVINK